MKMLVTGANGFLGRHAVAELLARGHAVRALVRPAARLDELDWPEAVEVFRGDLRAAKNLELAFEGIDVLVHLAAAVTGGEDVQFAASVVGTERLLTAMERSTTKRLVLASSFSVYDWSKARGTLTEETPVETGPRLYDRDGYAVAKVWQERVVRRFSEANGWSLTVLRPGFIWGRGNVYLACLGQKVGPLHLVFGPNTQIPLTHVENCARCFVLAAESEHAAGATFNVIDDDDVRIWGYLGDYLRHSGTRGVRVPVPYFLAKVGTHLAQAVSKLLFRGKGKLPSLLVPRRFEARFKPLRYSNLEARRRLGWQPAQSYEECLPRSYAATPRPDSSSDSVSSSASVSVPSSSSFASTHD